MRLHKGITVLGGMLCGAALDSPWGKLELGKNEAGKLMVCTAVERTTFGKGASATTETVLCVVDLTLADFLALADGLTEEQLAPFACASALRKSKAERERQGEWHSFLDAEQEHET